MKRGRHFLLFTLLAFLASFVFASDAMAADPSGQFTGLLDLIQQNSNNWFTALKGYATNVFWTLAFIQLVWTFFPLVFKQADFGEIVGELIRFVVVIGFFYLLLEKSQEYAGNIVDSFRQAGSTAAGLGASSLTPGGIFDVAVEMAQTIGSVETWNPLTATMIALAGLVVLLCFAFIAAFMGLTIIESYIVINASVLFMGFGGSTWTRDYAIAMLRYAVAVGAKLFVLTLLVGLVIQSAQQWQNAYNNTDQASMWTMIGLALACAYFCKTLPELVAGLITGVSPGGGSGIGMMAAAGAAGAAAAVGAIATAATAGAAAPVAAGGVAAAGGGGAAAAGGGGLAAAINSSIAGGASAGASAATGSTGAVGAASAGASGAGAVTGGGSAAGSTASAAGTAAKGATGAPGAAGTGGSTGGATTGQKVAGKAAEAAGKATASNNEGGSNSGATAAASPGNGMADDTTQKTGAAPAPEPAPSDAGGGSGLKMLASGMTRGAGIMSAISVPGMEGSAGLSLGMAPTNDAGSSPADTGSMEVSGADDVAKSNTIRGDGAVTPQSTIDTSADAGNASGGGLRSLSVPGMDGEAS